MQGHLAFLFLLLQMRVCVRARARETGGGSGGGGVMGGSFVQSLPPDSNIDGKN